MQIEHFTRGHVERLTARDCFKRVVVEVEKVENAGKDKKVTVVWRLDGVTSRDVVTAGKGSPMFDAKKGQWYWVHVDQSGDICEDRPISTADRSPSCTETVKTPGLIVDKINKGAGECTITYKHKMPGKWPVLTSQYSSKNRACSGNVGDFVHILRDPRTGAYCGPADPRSGGVPASKGYCKPPVQPANMELCKFLGVQPRPTNSPRPTSPAPIKRPTRTPQPSVQPSVRPVVVRPTRPSNNAVANRPGDNSVQVVGSNVKGGVGNRTTTNDNDRITRNTTINNYGRGGGGGGGDGGAGGGAAGLKLNLNIENDNTNTNTAQARGGGYGYGGGWGWGGPWAGPHLYPPGAGYGPSFILPPEKYVVPVPGQTYVYPPSTWPDPNALYAGGTTLVPLETPTPMPAEEATTAPPLEDEAPIMWEPVATSQPTMSPVAMAQSTPGGGMKWWWWVVICVLVTCLIAGGYYFWKKRKGRSGSSLMFL